MRCVILAACVIFCNSVIFSGKKAVLLHFSILWFTPRNIQTFSNVFNPCICVCSYFVNYALLPHGNNCTVTCELRKAVNKWHQFLFLWNTYIFVIKTNPTLKYSEYYCDLYLRKSPNYSLGTTTGMPPVQWANGEAPGGRQPIARGSHSRAKDL